MTVNLTVGGRVRQRALLVFVVLAGLFAMHGLTAGHDTLMPGGHQRDRATMVLTAVPVQPMGATAADVAVAGAAAAAAMDVSTDVSMDASMDGSMATARREGHAAAPKSAGSSVAPVTVTDSVASHLGGLPAAAMSMGAACIAILTGALALLLLALALAQSRSRSGLAPPSRYRDRAPRWPTDLGPPRRTSLTLVQLSLSRT